MKTFISLILSLAMAISGLFSSMFTKSEEPVSSTVQAPATAFCSKEEFDIYTAVNEVRKDSGVQSLELDEELCRFARIRAQEQIEKKVI